MKPCTYCASVNEDHNEACPKIELNKLREWITGYNDAKNGDKKKSNDPTYVLGWSMDVYLSKTGFLDHPGC